jgi:phosphoserine aminotransferase
MYNTPPVFAIYVMNLTLKWIKKSGGLSKMESMNREKARLIYDAIDKNDLYKGHAEKDSRSQMNITWNLTNKDLEAKFLEGAKALKMDGLKGHRSVGGLRASVYNAMPKQGCQALADYMNDFAEKNS